MRNKGVVLVLMLLFLFIFTLLTMSMAETSVLEVRMSANYRDTIMNNY